MAKPKKNTEKVTVFFTPEDMRRIEIVAEKKGLSKSGFIRFAMLECLDEYPASTFCAKEKGEENIGN